MFQTMLQDLRFALRQLRKSPGFTITAVLVFGLGIAASTAIFAFVDAALVRPLPYQDPGQLVALFERLPIGERFHISYGDYLDWKRFNRAFTSLDVYRSDLLTLKTAAGAIEAPGARVSDGFFRTLGVAPFLGRDFAPGEDGREARPVVILSYATWQKQFAARRDVLGQQVTIDSTPYLVIGVLPRGFHFAPLGSAGFWATLDKWDDHDTRLGHPYYGIARLKPGFSRAKAYADLVPIAQQIADAFPQTNRDRGVTVIPLSDLMVGDIRPTLVALLCAAGLLAFIGFVNVSSLLLVRAESRRREIAVRGALGASRLRLMRQFAVEGFLLSVSGCVLGLILAAGAIGILAGQIPSSLLEGMPYLLGLHVNGHLFLFAASLSIAGGLLFSAGPVLQLFLSDLQSGLMEGGRTAAGRTWRRAGASLVVAELAITVVLLMSAGLLARSFYRLLHEDVGMSTDHLAVLHVVDQDNDSANAHAVATERRVREAMAALPGAVSVGDSVEPAFASGEGYKRWFEHFKVIGRPYVGEGDEVVTPYVSASYFTTVHARLLRGRYFTDGDDLSKPRVALINRTMARQIFGKQDPLGKMIVGEWEKDHAWMIIGIVDDMKDGPLDAAPIGSVYRPLNQDPSNDFYVTLRTSHSTDEKAMLTSMIRAVHKVSPGLIADEEETMTDRMNNSQAAYLHRSAAWLVASFAGLALLLGSVGLYGVISYTASQRTREIGVRMALGAQRSSVYRLIMKEACWLALLGIGGGVLGSLAAVSLLRSMLFATSPWDATTMVCVALVLGTASLLASYLPARRAASINPNEALRAE